MRSVFAAVVALQALVASALPGALEARDVPKRCNADNCLRAVRNTNSLVRATSDCQAYFGFKIVTPCPVTVSGLVTTTVNEAASTVTVTSTTITTTLVSTSTATATITVAATIPMDKHKRQADTCPTSREGNFAIPPYASACGVGTRYSSACACFGVTTGYTTTLPAGTVSIGTATATVTNTFTSTSYVGSTITASSTTVVTITITSSTTSSSSSSSSSMSSSSSTNSMSSSTSMSSTSTSSSTSSTTSSAPVGCRTVAITYDGFNLAQTGQNFNRDFTTGTVTLGNASPLWYLQDNGKLTPLENKDQGIVLSQFESSGQPFDRMNVDSDPAPKNLQCSVAGGVLSCTGSNGSSPTGSNKFYLCPDYTVSKQYASGAGTLYFGDGTDVPDFCTQITLTASPRC